MTYLIIGLGNFGCALAIRLTAMGHDVIGVDSDIHVVEEHKDNITSTMQVLIRDSVSLSALPLDDADEVIVTLGQDIGDSIYVVSLLKQAGVKRLVARAINQTHKTVLETLGVDDVIMPETYAADMLALTSNAEYIKGVYIVSDSYQIMECGIPPIFEGLSLAEADIESNFSLNIIAVKRQEARMNFLGSTSKIYNVVPPDDDFRFVKNDRIVVYGHIKDFDKFKKQYR
ncbi:MAG: potassium channel family protein [Candidatus Aphodosoma sp.]